MIISPKNLLSNNYGIILTNNIVLNHLLHKELFLQLVTFYHNLILSLHIKNFLGYKILKQEKNIVVKYLIKLSLNVQSFKNILKKLIHPNIIIVYEYFNEKL